MRHAALFFALAVSGGVLDLWTKHQVFRHVEEYQDVPILEGFLHFGRTINRGVIFGQFPGADKLWLGISILAVPVILWIFFSVKKPKWILTITLGMILAGTLGNMADRVLFGAVRDFIKLQWKGHVWPLFNLADSYICVGVFLLSIEMLFFDEKKKKAPLPAPAAAASAGPLAVAADPPGGIGTPPPQGPLAGGGPSREPQ